MLITDPNILFGFAPTQVAGLQSWTTIDANTDPALLPDRSGAGYSLSSAATRPVKTTNGGVTVLRFDGNDATKPLKNTGDLTFTHIFLAACYDGTGSGGNFADYAGLISGASSGVLVGGSGTNAWFDFSDGISVKHNGSSVTPGATSLTNFCLNTLEVVQVKYASPQTLTGGLLLGSHQNIAGRVLKGDLAGHIIIYNNASMTAAQELRLRQFVAAAAGGISTS